MKIVFFGTSEVGLPILQKLILEGHEIIGVVTSPDAAVGRKQVVTPSPIAQFSETAGLNILKPEKVKNNPLFWEDLKNLHADIFVVVSYGKILPLEILDIAPLKTVNVHFSLLPKYRGAAPIQFALLNGETKTGTTIFVLDEGMDTGEMLASAELNIEPSDNFTTLADKLAYISAELLIETLASYKLGALTLEKQDDREATYTTLIKKEHGLIDWNKSAEEIHNQFRAFIQWPGIYTNWENQKIKILGCEVYNQAVANDLAAGTVTENYIVCGNNTALKINSLQLEGRNAVSFQDFLRGHAKFIGAQLPS